MNRKNIPYIVIAVVTLVVLMVLQYNRPKQINWFPSYVDRHKIPYGTYVFHNVIQGLFPGALQEVDQPPYRFLGENPQREGTYLFVNDQLVFEETERLALLEWTAQGNTLMVAAEVFEDSLLDTLGLEVKGLYDVFEEQDGPIHRLVNANLDSTMTYRLDRHDYVRYFAAFDTLQTKILGTVSLEGLQQGPKKIGFNVVKRPFGEGEIILSLFPKAFTNYFLLQDDNRNYMAGLLSYLDDGRPLFIDRYHKAGKTVYTSPMYLFLNTRELKWAYYVALIGVVLYVLFEGKRKQRAIPVVKPPVNQTLAYTRTIGDMYYEKKERRAIAVHMINVFLDYVRMRFHMGTEERNEQFYLNLASRSNHDAGTVKQLFSFFQHLKGRKELTDDDLRKLSRDIDNFKAKAHGGTS